MFLLIYFFFVCFHKIFIEDCLKKISPIGWCTELNKKGTFLGLLLGSFLQRYFIGEKGIIKVTHRI